VSSRLTLNLGLRNDSNTDTRECNGPDGGPVNIRMRRGTIGVPYHTAKMNFAPRSAPAWDPTGERQNFHPVGNRTYFNQVNQREAGASDLPALRHLRTHLQLDGRHDPSAISICACKSAAFDQQIRRGGTVQPAHAYRHTVRIDVQRQLHKHE